VCYLPNYMADFEVKMATEKSEIEQAQRLRFEVFNLELNTGLKSSYAQGLDVDEFDAYCDHLLVRDLRSREVVGTYRLLRGPQARAHIGFYSEKEFDLSQIKLLDGELMELGRSCARKDFRDRALIPLMWDAIAEQVKRYQVRYLFGLRQLVHDRGRRSRRDVFAAQGQVLRARGVSRGSRRRMQVRRLERRSRYP
jgi:putative hemolysin